MTRAAGERIRIAHAIVRLRSSIDSLEISLRGKDIPPGPDTYQPVLHAAADLACSVAKLGAFLWAEGDAKR
jgi:hypothetical protein